MQIKLELESVISGSSSGLSHPGPPLLQISGQLQLYFLHRSFACCLLVMSSLFSSPWSPSLTYSNCLFTSSSTSLVFVFICSSTHVLTDFSGDKIESGYFSLLLPLLSQSHFSFFYPYNPEVLFHLLIFSFPSHLLSHTTEPFTVLCCPSLIIECFIPSICKHFSLPLFASLLKLCFLSYLGLLNVFSPLSLSYVLNLTSHWNSSQQNFSVLLGQILTPVCQPQTLDPSAIFSIVAYLLKSVLWASVTQLSIDAALVDWRLLIISPPFNFVLASQLTILSLFLFCSHSFL